MARNTFIVQNTQRRLPRNSSSVGRGGEQSQQTPELVSGKVSVMAHSLLLEVTTGDRHLCEGTWGTRRERQREPKGMRDRGGKGPVWATQRVQGGSGGELIHLFSWTPSSLALLWKYQCFLPESISSMKYLNMSCSAGCHPFHGGLSWPW